MTLIDNPILNSPYKMPKAHFRFTSTGISDEIIPERRKSTYILPIPPIKSNIRMLPAFEEVPEENVLVNELRGRLLRWRAGGYTGVTATTSRLLEYWQDSERENKLFFCQIEALETLIYLTEVMTNRDKLYEDIQEKNREYNGSLYRLAMKMATGTGKTIVMGMIIAWHTLNKVANPRSARHLNHFLIVSPGITIRDRLRVLMPEETNNYYMMRDLVPADMRMQLMEARIAIVNFHQFQRRTTVDMSAKTKKILLQGRDEKGAENPFMETPNQMADRVCKVLGRGQIIVLNDEAHHCYIPKKVTARERLDREESTEAKKDTEEARMWFNGLETIHERIGIRVVYDLSATPFFLRGSGYGEGTIFPWVVSDFSLVDAIESGLVKIPRVPVTDNSQSPIGPVNRFVWETVRDKLPKVQADIEGEPTLPKELEASLWSLYEDYRKRFEYWEKTAKDYAMPPVMIVVCNNTAVSQLMYRYIAGWERKLNKDIEVVEDGKLPLFNNVEKGGWRSSPNTILVDSRELESGKKLSEEFRDAMRDEIESFTREYYRRYPERQGEEISESDIMREVMNTVGKRGKLGESVRCVVSVSMLSEGWDVNSVTHILGVRAFRTQLLCEQVVGRGLRRMSYEVNDNGLFEPEYAEIYGVPFAFIPTSGKALQDKVGKPITFVEALPERAYPPIEFPRVIGYRYESLDRLEIPDFSKARPVQLTTENFPTRTVMAGMTGEENIHTLAPHDQRRWQTILYKISQGVLEMTCKQTDGKGGEVLQTWLFPDVLKIVREWFGRGLLEVKDGMSLDFLSFSENQSDVVSAIASLIQRTHSVEQILPIFARDGKRGTTLDARSFETVRPVYQTSAKCPYSFAVMDTRVWEQKVVEVLEAMPEVVRYVKNYNLGFTIPYAFHGMARSYIPDFIVVLDNGTNLIIEVTGEDRDDKAEKVATARDLWLPSVNACKEFGQWAFLEIRDIYRAEQEIRAIMGKKVRLI